MRLAESRSACPGLQWTAAQSAPVPVALGLGGLPPGQAGSMHRLAQGCNGLYRWRDQAPCVGTYFGRCLQRPRSSTPR